MESDGRGRLPAIIQGEPNVAMWLFAFLLTVNTALIGLWTIGLFAGVKGFPLEFQRLLNPDGEGNFVTWYSNLLLILVAVVSFANFWLENEVKMTTRSVWRFAWLVIAAVTLFLSLDEIAQIHEGVQASLMSSMQGRGDWAGWVGTRGRAWILPYLPGILTVVIVFLLAFFHMFKDHRGSLVLGLAGVGFWIFALVMEFFFMDILRLWGDWYFSLELVLEETAEIMGSSCLLLAFVWFRRARIYEIFDDEGRGMV